MNNVSMKVDGDTLIIRCKLNGHGEPSSTGKSLVFASTKGNQEVPNGAGLKLGLNLFRAADK